MDSKVINEFYSIAAEGESLVDVFQLKNLGKQRLMMSYGRSNDTNPKRIYTNVKSEDYDGAFAYKIIETKPPYEIHQLLNFHLDYYVNINGGEEEKFIKQMKYVVLPLVKKQHRVVYVDLMNEWIEEKSPKAKSKHAMTQITNHIKTGDIHAPTQFQQNSDNSSQTQHLQYSKEDVDHLFALIKAEFENLSQEQKDEFQTEMDYASKQLEKGKSINQQLLNIGSLMTNIGLPFFVNLISSGVFELMKPALGIH